MRVKVYNNVKRAIALCILFLLFWEAYAVIRYREALFFLRFMRGGYYSFTEYVLLLLAALLVYGVLSSKYDRSVYRQLQGGWKDFTDIWKNIVKPLENAKYTAILSLLFLAVFGYEIFNFTLSLDEEFQFAGLSENEGWCYEGRFSITVLKDLLMEFGMYQPCLSNLLGAVLLVLTGMCVFSLIKDKLRGKKLNDYLSLVFLAGFLSFPSVIAESQSISTYCIEISFGMFCTALAVIYLDRYYMTKEKRNIVFNIVLLAFAIGIYQAMTGLYITLVLIYFLTTVFAEQEVSNEKAGAFLRRIISSAIFFLMAMAVFYLVYKAATTIHHVESSIEYINEQSGWDLEYGIFKSFARSVEQLTATLFQTQIPGIKFFAYYMVVGSLLTIFFLIAYPNLKGAICGGLVVLITLSGYIMWIGLAATSLPFRVWLASPAVCGFLYFMAVYVARTHFHRKYYLLCQIAVTIILFRQVQTVNELFYNDHVRMEKDVAFARELYHDICYEVGIPNADTPIVLIGTVDLGADNAIVQNPYTDKYWGGNCLGYSLWRRAQEPLRMNGFYYVLGYTLNFYSCYDADVIAYAQSDMTVYPQKGSIALMNGIVYVRLQ